MFDIVRKDEYFDHLSSGFANPTDHTLKGIQDGWVLAQLHDVTGKRLLEIGGGNSRVLPQLENNNRWNAEKFQGVGNGPVTEQEQLGVTVVPTFMGEFSDDVPEVDIIFSISVIEHIPFDSYGIAFADMARCLAPGGEMYHAVDLPLGDSPSAVANERIRMLQAAVEEAGLRWRETPVLAKDCTFSSEFASNSDLTQWMWSQISDAARISAPTMQIVTIKLIATKPL